LEAENAKLKRLLADAMLDNAAMKNLLEKMVTPAAGREAVAHLLGGCAMSERRACRVVAAARSGVRYQRRRPDDDRLRKRLKALAEERRRFGYRRLWVLLCREHHGVDRKRVYRLYQDERLMVRRRGGRKRATGVRSPLPLLDDYTRECLALVATRLSRASALPASSTRLLLCVVGPAASSRIMAPSGDPGLVGSAKGRLALHRLGQTSSERLHRKL
jgi:putative transposase